MVQNKEKLCLKSLRLELNNSTKVVECQGVKLFTSKQLHLLLLVALPLMCRVHKYVQQAGELVYCDATSGLDGCICAMYVISCSNVAGGTPRYCCHFK